MNNSSTEFVWRLENFSKYKGAELHSDKFTISGYEWRIICAWEGNLNLLGLYLYMDVAHSATLPTEYTTFKFVVLDQMDNKFSMGMETKYLFTNKKYYGGYTPFMPLSKLRDSSRAYLLNDTLVVKVEIKAEPPGSLTTVSNVVPGLTMKPQEPKAVDDRKHVPNIAHPHPTPPTEVVQDEGTNGLRRTEGVHLPDLPETEVEKANVNEIKAKPTGSLTTVSNVVPLLAVEPQEPKAVDDSNDAPNIPDPDSTTLTEVVQHEGSNGLRRTEVIHLPDQPETEVENANVNGFQVLASKADIVERIFEKHPDFVSNFHLKNHQFRSAFMNSILALIEKFCQPPADFSEGDLSYSRTILTDLGSVGFQVDWLTAKLEEVVRRKRQAGELVKKLEEMKQVMHDLEAEAESASASLSINDIV